MTAAEKKALEAKNANTALAIIPITDTREIVTGFNSNNEDVLNAALLGMEAMPDDNFVSISGEYADWNKGEIHNIVALGVSETTFSKPNSAEKQTKECVFFAERNKDGEVKNYIHAGAVLVSTVNKEVAKGANFPMGLRVKITGEAKSPAGTYLTMEISRLYA